MTACVLVLGFELSEGDALGLMQEFKAFLSEYKVLGLAVAFILGIYLGAVVKALVTDLILPIVQLALPAGMFLKREFH